MEFYPDVMRQQLDNLNHNLGNLNSSIGIFRHDARQSQNRLITWTKVMACAIILQAIAIGVQIFFSYG